MNVRTVWERHGVSLVEWMDDGEPRRALLPSSDVGEDGQCEYPERGIEYGIPWSMFITVEVTPSDIERELKKAGIWTVGDLYHRPREAQGAVVAAYGAVLSTLLRNVKLIQPSE